jgi:hypothetical protein
LKNGYSESVYRENPAVSRRKSTTLGPIFVYPYAPFLSIRETLIFEGEDFDSETRGMDRILVEDWIGKDQKESIGS